MTDESLARRELPPELLFDTDATLRLVERLLADLTGARLAGLTAPDHRALENPGSDAARALESLAEAGAAVDEMIVLVRQCRELVEFAARSAAPPPAGPLAGSSTAKMAVGRAAAARRRHGKTPAPHPWNAVTRCLDGLEVRLLELSARLLSGSGTTA